MTLNILNSLNDTAENKSFKINVTQTRDRWCVYESSITGLLLETDDLVEMAACIEDIAPYLIMNNHHVKENELTNVVIRVFVSGDTWDSQVHQGNAKPRILWEHR